MDMSKFRSFIGIDLHKSTLTVGVLDATKNIKGVKAIDTKCVNKIVDYIKSFPSPIACTIESVGMYEWLWELLEDKVDYLVLADAAEVKRRRQRGKAKTDRNDSLLLARLLLIDEIPASYVPDKTYRSLRKLGRHYHTISEMLADVKIRMRWIFNQNNFPGPKNISSHSAQRWLLARGHLLDFCSLIVYKNYLSLIEKLELDKACIIREMNLIAKHDQFERQFKILRSVPGVGPVISFIILAEIADFSRFPNTNAIACYTGLTEKTNESAGHRKPGRISKCGNPTLRWAMVEATTTMIQHDESQKDKYEAIVAHKGGETAINKSKAKVAVAQKLARALWKMMKEGEFFRKGKPTPKQAELNAKRLAAESVA